MLSCTNQCFTFVDELPPAPMSQVTQDFIKYSIEGGHLRDDFILYGHRQVRNTECPGNALYAVIQKWPHWQDRNRKRQSKTAETEILAPNYFNL